MNKNLQEQRVYLKAINSEQLVFFDMQRRLQTRPIESFVRLEEVSERKLQIPNDIGIIEFVDGQRIRGRIVHNETNEDGAFFWDCMIGDRWDAPTQSNVFDQALQQQNQPTEQQASPAEGFRKRISVNLDEVRRLTFATTPNEIPVTEEDILVLRNGERINGFVIETKGNTVLFQMDNQDQPIAIPINQISAMSLLNQEIDYQSGNYIIIMKDGSRIYADTLVLQDQTITMTTSLTGQGVQEVNIPLDTIHQIDIIKSGYRLAYLNQMEMQTVSPSIVFGKNYKHKLSNREMKLHAPITLQYKLPHGVVRLGAIAELDEQDDLPQLQGWADMNLIFKGHNQQDKYQLNNDNKQHHIRIDLTGQRELTIELDEGMNGPILDRMRLRNAMLLIKAGPQKSITSQPQ